MMFLVKHVTYLIHFIQLNRVPLGGSHQFKWLNLPELPRDAWVTTFSSCMLFFGGEGNNTNYGDQEKAHLRIPTRGPVNKRRLTDIFLAINVL